MRREAIPHELAIRLQLAAFAGGATNGYFEIRAKRVVGHGMEQAWIPVHETERAARAALTRGQVTDTYIGAAIRTRRAGGLDAIESVNVLWADCDSREALERLSAFRPLPAIVIRSGSENSAHAYWPLHEPIPPAWAKRANRRLALALGADRNATDAARVLRPAGTFNHKASPPRPVLCTRLELDVFEIGEVVGHLPDDRDYVRVPSPRTSARGEMSKALDALARTVHEAAVGNRNAALYWAACRVREHAALGQVDAAEAREILREAALATGLAEHEIERTLDSALENAAAA